MTNLVPESNLKFSLPRHVVRVETVTDRSTKTIPWHARPMERMEMLSIEAAGDCLKSAFASDSTEKLELPLLMAVPPERPGITKDAVEQLVEKIMDSLPIKIDRGQSGYFNSDHEGGMAALKYACDSFRDAKTSACLTGASIANWISTIFNGLNLYNG